MDIKTDSLNRPEIAELLQQHRQNMLQHSPPESIHALNLDALRQPDITFWSVWAQDELLGCGALKELDAGHGEIKSMCTVFSHQRKGVAAKLLEHILAEAKSRHYTRLSLETGSMAAFTPAHRLYAKYGFTPCRPFADYTEDPYSLFMTKTL